MSNREHPSHDRARIRAVTIAKAAGAAWNDLVNGTDPVGFIYDAGTWIPFNDPLGVEGTYPYDINDNGDIVGDYVDAGGNFQAFVATPVPEPASLAVLAVGLIGLGFAEAPRVRRAAQREKMHRSGEP